MKNVNFEIHEIGELYSLEFLIKEFQKYNFYWNIYLVPYNTDFNHINIDSYFHKYSNVSLFDSQEKANEICIGFKSDISNKFPIVNSCIDIYELATCNKIHRDLYINDSKKFDIVVTNVKINDKNIHQEYNPKMWELLGKLPYTIAVIPRHPFPKNFLTNVNIPENITVFNQIGIVKELCANTSLTVMGLIFSDCCGETEHNPFEATLNSNAITSSTLKIEESYKEYYNTSGLIHPFNNFEESIPYIDDLINDHILKKKLQNKDTWIEYNRQKVLPKIFNIITNT